MQRKKIMAMLMISLFFTAGCLGALEDEVECRYRPSFGLENYCSKSGIDTELIEFDDCDDLGQSKRQFERLSIQLLQAVGNITTWDDVMFDGDVAEASDSATGGTNTPTPRRVEGTDYWALIIKKAVLRGRRSKNRRILHLFLEWEKIRDYGCSRIRRFGLSIQHNHRRKPKLNAA